MQLPPILGHDRVLQRFVRSMRRGRLASSFLFLGPLGIGKRTTALYLTQCLLCETTPTDHLAACGTCQGCQQVAALTHPDMIVVSKPQDKSFIPVESFIGDREHRMREGLCHDISLKPFRGGRKVAIVDDADYLNQEGANCLLKTLEEPPHGSVLILIGTSEQRQLPTIRSRCQIVRFTPLSHDTVAQLLAARCDLSSEQIEAVAHCAGGSLSRALELADTEVVETQRSLVSHLDQPGFDSHALAEEVTNFVNAAGKDAPPRRARLRYVIRAFADFYRDMMRQTVMAAHGDSERVRGCVETAPPRCPLPPVVAADCLDRCLDAFAQLDANANLPTLIACWIDDLSERARRDQ
ncbi:MAG: ATP-binding protein [Planctomycetota bacterium]